MTFAKNPCLACNGCSSATYWTRNLLSTVISGSTVTGGSTFSVLTDWIRKATVTGGSTFSVSTDWIRKATVICGSMFSVSDSQFGRTPTKLSSPPVRQIRKQLLLSLPMVDICILEETVVVEGIEMNDVWQSVRENQVADYVHLQPLSEVLSVGGREFASKCSFFFLCNAVLNLVFY